MAPSDRPVLLVEGLRRSFGDRLVVDDVDLRIEPGETYGLLGPNGAGKTTTISMICGLLQPDAGRVVIAGETMRTDRCSAKSRVGLVPQEVALYPDLSARENLEFFARMQRLDAASSRTRVDAVLETVGLADRADDRVDDFSGGMQRRCNIAVALLHEPQLLILDEPTVGVDPQSRSSILDGIAELEQGGTAVLYTTHYMEEAERLCDRIGIMDQGRLLAEGSMAELVALVSEHPVLRLHGDGGLDAVALDVAAIGGVVAAESVGGRLDVVVERTDTTVAAVLQAAAQRGVAVSGLEVQNPDLEDVFLHLTGKALRD